MKYLILFSLLFASGLTFSQDTYTFVNPNSGLDEQSYIDLFDGRFGDINGDGLVDVLEEEYYIPYLGGANFGDKTPLGLSQSAPPYMDIEDVNNDGYDDLATSSEWQENLGNSQFSSTKLRPDFISYDTPSIPPTSTSTLITVDLDGDGDGDKIGYSQLDYGFYLYENINNTHYLDRVLLAGSDIAGGFFFPSQLKEVRASDFNNDGLIDVLVITQKKLIYFHNEGNMNFSTVGNLHDNDFTIRRWDIEDINLDGYLDVVLGTIQITGGSAYGGITYCKGTNQGLLSPQSIFSDGPVEDVKFGLREDGTHDIYSVYESTVWHHIPNSNYTLFSRNDIISDVQGRYLVLRDIDSDEDIDIIVHSQSPNRIGYYLKNEDINFEPICPDDNVLIQQQSDIDYYKLNYGNCRNLEYSLTINRDNWSNANLSDAFSELESIAGNFSLVETRSLDLSTFLNLKFIGGDFNIKHLKTPNLSFLRNLEEIGGNLNIETAWPLTDAFDPDELYNFNDLQNFKKLGKGIRIYNAHFRNVDKIITSPVIYGDINLWGGNTVGFKDLSNLDILEEITGSLFIGRADVNNDQISLKNLKHVAGNFRLKDNSNLTSLDFLNDELVVDGEFVLATIGDMEICESFALCNHIANGGDFNIDSDDVTCFTNNQLVCSALVPIEDVAIGTGKLTVYPIPSSTMINITTDNLKFVNYQIFDLSGSALLEGIIENHGSINIKDLRDGTYVLRAFGDESSQVFNSRFMKITN